LTSGPESSDRPGDSPRRTEGLAGPAASPETSSASACASDGARVCVIGAVVCGLLASKVLSRDGFDVTVFEKDSAVGGVWSPSRAYAGLRTNNPRETYAFSDHPFPSTADDFPTARQVREYLESYVERFGLGPLIELGTEVRSVARGAGAGAGEPVFRVTVRQPDDGAEPETRAFDLVVVCNGVFSKPHIPRIEGAERFGGQSLHSSQVVDPEVLDDRKVVVVGGGKSALDLASLAARRTDDATLVRRRTHWVFPRYFFGRVRVDRMLFNRFSEKVLPAYHRAGISERAFRTLSAPFIWLWRRAFSGLVRRQAGIPQHMTPDVPVTSGAENFGIGEEFYDLLARGRVDARRGSIVSFPDEVTVELDTGERLEADVVVWATGWRQGASFLAPELEREVWRDGWFHLYRHILPPVERRLGFVGYQSSGNCPLTSEIAAHWLSQVFRGELALPSPGEMEREIARVHRWSERVFPRRPEGYFIGGYVSQYVDELMGDMGLSTRRAPNVLAEYLGPFWAERYRGVAAERRRVSAPGDEGPAGQSPVPSRRL
jgi:dimethylaniline monooxygenase (N-oxide forming)